MVGNTEERYSTAATRKPTEYVQTHFACSGKSYALEVVGNSIEPSFSEGDIVVIDPILRPAPGDLVHVEFSNGTVLFRRYRPQAMSPRPTIYDLIPANIDWPTIRIDSHNPSKIRGVMSEHIRPRRRQG
jgi:SOS-response transcriptional repressor LexA